MSGTRVSLGLAAAALLLAAPASGYVRSRTMGCHVTYWPRSCVAIEPDSALYPLMDSADVLQNIQDSINAWQTQTTMAYIKLDYVVPHRPLESAFDGQPVIKFRTDTWCRPASAYDKKLNMNSPTCYDSGAAAITTVYFVNKASDPNVDGMILDADIELNGVDFRYYDADKGVPQSLPNLIDLRNGLTHELGHLQGLDHSCRISYNDGAPACLVDQSGNVAPLCGNVPSGSAVAQTAMFATAPPRETVKRTPKADDVAGIDAAYPLASDVHECAAAPYVDSNYNSVNSVNAAGMMTGSSTGCGAAATRTAPSSAATGWAMGGLAALLGLALRASRRRRA